MNRTDRLYAIAEELRSAGRGGCTGERLAARFEVSGRTIKRDIDALLQAGAPIWAQSGPGGGYVLDAAASLPPLNLTAAEATAVALALAASPDLPFAPDGRAALTKVLAAMPGPERERARDLGQRIWVRNAALVPRAPVARALDEALRTRVVAVLDYTDGAGTTSKRREVEPMAFARTAGHWNLLAWCRTRRAGRWFRLDRVSTAHLTREVAPVRDLREVFGEPPHDAGPVDLSLRPGAP